MRTVPSAMELDELTPDERLLRESVRELARDVIRPAAAALDRMTAEERIQPGSPYFTAMKAIREMGLHKLYLTPEQGGPELTPRGRFIVHEELAWGSLGLATAAGVDGLPFTLIGLAGQPELQEELLRPWAADSGRFAGCWGVTEPDHGSDYLGFLRAENPAAFGRGNVSAEQDGDSWIIRGQKSAWVSSAPVATHCGLHAQIKGSDSLAGGLFLIMPLDLPGVRRGRPVEMLGTRDDPQGELFFDEVRLPGRYVLAAPPFYNILSDQLLCLTSCAVGAYAVGLARAAFEEALAYARTRVQGGAPIVRHQNIQLMLYRMFEQIETARAYVRKAMEYTHLRILDRRTFDASPRHARTAQIYAKKAAFAVAHDALQIFGANGLSQEYPIEKLFRDARSLLIEDGTVEVLSLEAAADVIENYEKDGYDPSAILKGVQ